MICPPGFQSESGKSRLCPPTALFTAKTFRASAKNGSRLTLHPSAAGTFKLPKKNGWEGALDPLAAGRYKDNLNKPFGPFSGLAF